MTDLDQVEALLVRGKTEPSLLASERLDIDDVQSLAPDYYRYA